MAIDTKQKRESSVGIALSFLRVQPTPDGSDADSVDERVHLAFNYNGIAPAAAAVSAAILRNIPLRAEFIIGRSLRADFIIGRSLTGRKV